MGRSVGLKERKATDGEYMIKPATTVSSCTRMQRLTAETWQSTL